VAGVWLHKVTGGLMCIGDVLNVYCVDVCGMQKVLCKVF